MKTLLIVLFAGSLPVTLCWLIGPRLVAQVVGQTQGTIIRPDGITHVTREHKVDLSSCDTIKIEGPADRIGIMGGRFQVYGFKKYGIDFTVTCLVENKQ